MPPHSCAKAELLRVASKNARNATLGKEILNIVSISS
jgi:hypothetical protein